MKEFTVGMQASRSKYITWETIQAFAAVTGDYNSLHGECSPLGRPVAHGMLVAGLVSAVLGNDLPGPGALYRLQELRFVRPVYAGDTITATCTLKEWNPEQRTVRMGTSVQNQRNELVLSGWAELLLIQAGAETP